MKKISNRSKTLIFFLTLFFVAGCDRKNDNQNNLTTIEIGKEIIRVEIADSPRKWELGLSYKDTLPKNHGMLFVFPDEHRRVFWMRGCNFDIDLAYIESDGTISEIITMKKEPLNTPLDSLKTYLSRSTTIKYVLEMIGGWFDENNIKTGKKIDLDHLGN